MKPLLVIAGLLLIAVSSGRADTTISAEASRIIARADRARGNIEGVTWTTDIRSVEDGEQTEHTLIVKNRGINTLAEFIAPAKIKGRKLLMLDRNMWFIKPGLQKPVPISQRQKLAGSAANGDIASTHYARDYRAALVGEEAVAGENCLVFELKAINAQVSYDRIRYWISVERQLGMQAEFYTVSGKHLKTARFKYDNRLQMDDGIQSFISEMAIQDRVAKENSTVMTYRDIQIGHVPESDFNLNLLMR